MKITDARAVDPTDFTPPSCFEDGIGHLFRAQSHNYCFVLKSLLGKDTKMAYEEFSAS